MTVVDEHIVIVVHAIGVHQNDVLSCIGFINTHVAVHVSACEFVAANQSVTVLSSAGQTNNSAPVHPVLVHAVTSQLVAFSTLPATVVLAFTTDHVALVDHAPPI